MVYGHSLILEHSAGGNQLALAVPCLSIDQDLTPAWRILTGNLKWGIARTHSSSSERHRIQYQSVFAHGRALDSDFLVPIFSVFTVVSTVFVSQGFSSQTSLSHIYLPNASVVFTGFFKCDVPNVIIAFTAPSSENCSLRAPFSFQKDCNAFNFQASPICLFCCSSLMGWQPKLRLSTLKTVNHRGFDRHWNWRHKYLDPVYQSIQKNKTACLDE